MIPVLLVKLIDLRSCSLYAFYTLTYFAPVRATPGCYDADCVATDGGAWFGSRFTVVRFHRRGVPDMIPFMAYFLWRKAGLLCTMALLPSRDFCSLPSLPLVAVAGRRATLPAVNSAVTGSRVHAGKPASIRRVMLF